jgi:hypothetical protein
MREQRDMTNISGFWLMWSDWRGYAEGSCRPAAARGHRVPPPPPMHRDYFATHAEAEMAKAALRAAGNPDLVLSIVPVPAPRAKAKPLFSDLPIMKKKLTQ